MELNRIKLCEQSDCSISNTGKCLENLRLEECPHFYWSDNVNEEEIILNGVQFGETFKALPEGDALPMDKAIEITHKFKPVVIIIIGDFDSGKTTLSATIHELFQRSPFNKLWFSGTVTPIGFEKRCYYARVSSGNSTSKTEKTKVGESSFLHLSLKRESETDKPAIHLLMSDISGELFRLARNSSDSMNSLSFLKSASRILLTLDGEKLADRRTKSNVIVNIKAFITKALEEGIFDSDTYLDIAITKWDAVQKENQDKLMEDVRITFSKIVNDRVKEINYLKLAARPNSYKSDIQLGYGLDELLDIWLADIQYMSDSDLSLHNNTFYATTQTDRQFIKVLSHGV